MKRLPGKTVPGKVRKEMGRGSSAIYDECQAVFIVTGEKDTDKRITHEKDRELGYTVEEFGLRFEDLPASSSDVSPEDEAVGGLRVVVVGSLVEQQADRVIAFLSNGPFEGSKGDLVERLGMGRTEGFQVLGDLVRKGRITILGRSKADQRPRGVISLVATDDAGGTDKQGPVEILDV